MNRDSEKIGIDITIQICLIGSDCNRELQFSESHKRDVNKDQVARDLYIN